MYVWLQPGGETGVANAGVVVDDDGLTVIDTLMVRSQWEPFAAAVHGARAARCGARVLTHAHIDHVGGTKAFPAAAVYAHAGHELTRSTSRCRSTRTRRSCPRSTTSSTTSPSSARGRSRTSSTAPRRSRPRIELLPATGHTAGDLMVLVADVDVCFAGDLCFFGVTPLAFQGDPAVWADMLDVVAELADVIVPGHGPVGGEAEVRELQAYLRACVAANGDADRDRAGPVGHVARPRAATPSTSSAPRCSPRGDDEMPPSMLKAIGCRRSEACPETTAHGVDHCAAERDGRWRRRTCRGELRMAKNPDPNLKLDEHQGSDAHARRLVDDVPPRAR